MTPVNPNAIIILSFDFGMKHIGLAIGQMLTKTANPLITLSAHDGIPNWAEIENIIHDWHPSVLIVGIPLNMDDTEQPMTFCAKRFVRSLHERFRLPIHTVDERLSTWEAKKRIKKSGSEALKTIKGIKSTRERTRTSKSKKAIGDLNAMAAAILLEQWMNDNPT